MTTPLDYLVAIARAVRLENFTQAVYLVAALFLAYATSHTIYNIWFHPLSRFPGPLLGSAFYFPFGYKTYVKGVGADALKKLHEQYGPIVRVGPNNLSFDGEIGWPAVFARRTPEYEKQPRALGGYLHIQTAKTEIHRRQRRQLSGAFSESSLLKQESIITKYIDMLMASVAEQAKSDNEPMDIVRWLNFTTFDIIGDLAFSESFRSLESRAHNPWVLSIFRGLRGAAFLAMLSQYPIFQFLIKGLELSSSIKQFDEILNHARNKAKARMSYGSKRFERKDFMTYMLDGPDGKPGMETEEILQNAPVLVIAGSETVATAMAGFFFYAGQHPEVYAKAAMEIRSAFNSESEISIAQVTSLRYLTAVIQETLRIYPPAPVTPERLSPGDTINGNYVPAGVLNILESPVTKGDAHTNSYSQTVVTMSIWSTFRNPEHWIEPDSYIPERWLPTTHPLHEDRFEYDNHSVFKPFSYGPRDCIGQNLAFMEMRLIIAKLLYRFDFELVPGQEAWQSSQRFFIVWEKGPLYVKFCLRET